MDIYLLDTTSNNNKRDNNIYARMKQSRNQRRFTMTATTAAAASMLVVLMSSIITHVDSFTMIRSGLSAASRRYTTPTSSSASSSSSHAAGRTLYDKIWDSHVVDDSESTVSLIYVDRHLVHEVTSPQAFEGLRVAQRGVRRPDCTLCTVDHNVPTTNRQDYASAASFIDEVASRTQVLQLEQNVRDFGLKYFGMADERYVPS